MTNKKCCEPVARYSTPQTKGTDLPKHTTKNLKGLLNF